MKKATPASAEAQYKKMTETPVKKLIATLALPTVISMLITMIYNAADTFFVSKISVPASGATGIVFSLMALLQAFGFMYGHGAGSNISRRLGAKEIESARTYCTTAFFLALVTALLIMAGGLLFLTPLMRALGSTPTILPYAKSYALWILIAAPAMATSCVMNNIMRYEGMAKLAVIGLATGGILNIFLDPLLIFVCKLGIHGAGIATAFSQYLSMGILLYFFLKKKTQSRIALRYFSFRPRISWDIISVGAPSFARQGLNSVSTMLLNVQAEPYGDECIAAISIVAKLFMFIFSVCIGIGQGFQPVCSFNYGAKKYDRVREAIRFLWLFSGVVLIAISAAMFAVAPQVVALFRGETRIVEIGSAALRYLCVAMCFMPTVTCANMTFQSVGLSGKAFFLACAQNGLYFIPLVLVLPRLCGITGIEIAQPLAYILAAVTALPLLLSFYRKLNTEH
ncbi:MAG: MATE family efflux transporter [Clostridia bacterium]|nr:MATE family efflux transporter [Clostridia bacterium]